MLSMKKKEEKDDFWEQMAKIFKDPSLLKLKKKGEKCQMMQFKGTVRNDCLNFSFGNK